MDKHAEIYTTFSKYGNISFFQADLKYPVKL